MRKVHMRGRERNIEREREREREREKRLEGRDVRTGHCAHKSMLFIFLNGSSWTLKLGCKASKPCLKVRSVSSSY